MCSISFRRTGFRIQSGNQRRYHVAVESAFRYQSSGTRMSFELAAAGEQAVPQAAVLPSGCRTHGGIP